MSPTSLTKLSNEAIDEEEYIRILEEELAKGTFKEEAIDLAWQGARQKYQDRGFKLEWPSWKSLLDWPKTEEEKKEWFRRGIKGFGEAPEAIRKTAVEYLGRPGEAVLAGIEAGVEGEGILSAMWKGFTGEKQTEGREILKLLGLPLDASEEEQAEWMLDHPVQHFLLEMAGPGLEYVTDPVIWALWFTPITKIAGKVQKTLAKKEITQFAKLLKKDLTTTLPAPGPKASLESILRSPRYSKFTNKLWWKELAPHLGIKTGVGVPSYVYAAPANISLEALAKMPKYAPLLSYAASAGMKAIPLWASEGFESFQKALPPELKELHSQLEGDITPEKALGFQARDPQIYQGQTVADVAASKYIWENVEFLKAKHILALKNKQILELTNEELDRLSTYVLSWGLSPHTEGAARKLDVAITDIKTDRGLYKVEPEKAPEAPTKAEYFRSELAKYEERAAELGGTVGPVTKKTIRDRWEKLYGRVDKPEIVPEAGVEEIGRPYLFAEEEITKTKQMDMYKQELATLNKAGILGREAEQKAMKIAGDKYRKVTKAQGKQLEWNLGAPTLKGQKEFRLDVPPEEATRAVEAEAEESIEFKELQGGVKRIQAEQNQDVEERVLLSGAVPDIYDQDLYIHNLKDEHIEDPEKKLAVFKELLEKNNPQAFEALSSEKALSEEELAVKIYALDNAIKKLSRVATSEWQGVRDALFEQQATPELESLHRQVLDSGGIKYSSVMKDYPEEWQMMPVSLKKKTGLALDEMADTLGMDIEDLVEKLARYKPALKKADFQADAFNEVENNPKDYPNYARRAELQNTRQRYYDRLTDLGAALPPAKPSDLIEQKEVTIERTPDEPEEDLYIPPEYTPGQIRSLGQIEWSDIVGPFEGKYPTEIKGGKLTPGRAEQMVFKDFPPEDITSEVEPWDRAKQDVWWIANIRLYPRMFSDFERATGIPIYSQGYRQIKLASRAMRKEQMIENAALKQLWDGIPEERREFIADWYIGEAPKDFKITDSEKDYIKAMENWFKYWGPQFGIPKERMLPKYLSRIFKAHAEGDPSLLPKDLQASFKKHRLREDPFKERERDPLKIMQWYLHAGLRDKYLWESGLIPDFLTHVKKQPIGIKKLSERWIKHNILRHPTELDMWLASGWTKLAKLRGFDKIADKWGVDAITGQKQVLRAMAQVMYSSGIGFRGLSPAKNFTQQIHNLIILGPKYFFKGVAGAWTKENRELAEALDILRNYGAELERRGIDNPASVPQRIITAGNIVFRLVDTNSRLAFLSGYGDLVTDRYADYQAGKIDKAQFFKKTHLDMTPYGIQEEMSNAFLSGDVETYKNIGAQELIHLGQFTYEPEDMPPIFQGATGRFASVFMTWPIEYAEMMWTFAETGHWERFLYYYLAATVTQNVLREMGIETNPYGYADIEIGDHRISLIPGGWFLFGAAPTGLSPGLNILAVGGKALMVFGKGASDAYLKQTARELKQASKILVPYGLTAFDMIDLIEEIRSGTYGKRDKNGNLLYISDSTETILRAFGFTTTKEAKELGRYREPIYEFKQAREGYWTSPFTEMGQGWTPAEQFKQSPFE